MPRKKEASSAVYASKNSHVAAGIREPFEGRSGDPLQLSIRMFPAFQGRLAIRDGGGTVVITCKDAASKNALIAALQDALSRRDLDERRWRDNDEAMERERKEGT